MAMYRMPTQNMAKSSVTEAPSGPAPAADTQPDLTGRSRLVSNVLFSWAAHSVFIVAGFVMPRMIDRRLGQDLLGVWDFSWSLVNYFQLVRASIGSSVNRYIAKYRAVGDVVAVNRVASSAAFVLGAGGLLVMILTAILSLLLPRLFGDRLGPNLHEAQWVVLLLGATMAVQISSSVFNGILTGCHRWDLHNINTSGWYAVTAVGMVAALLSGGGLRSLAAVTLVGEVLAAARRAVLAHRVCEGLRLRPLLVQWQTVRKLFAFGGKTLIPSVSNLLLNQTTSVLIVAYLGPAALALYSRPRSLVYQVRTLVNKMAMTLTPTASSLQSEANRREIGDLAVRSARYALYLSLPIVLVLVVFGGPIMRFWMGPCYGNGWLPAVLAVGYLPVLVQLPTLSILAGFNAHGRAGIARFVASLVSVGLSILTLKYLRWGLVGTALAITLPLAILNLVDIPRLICRRVGLHMGRYYVAVAVGPVLHTLPFAACLIAARLALWTRPLVGLCWAGGVGGVVLAAVYWRNVLPGRLRSRILAILRLGRRRVCSIVFER